MISCAEWDWRIALSEAGLQYGSVINHELPPPTIAPYTEWQTAVTRSDGSQARHGMVTVAMMWSELSESQLFTLRKLITDAQTGTGLIYMTIDRMVGLTRRDDFIDISGFPHLAPTGTDAPVADRVFGMADHKDYVLEVKGLTVINDPSLYTT